MDLKLTDEQRQLQMLVRQYCRDRFERQDGSLGQPATAETWLQLAALGLLDLAAGTSPATGIVEQVIVADELGRALLCTEYAPAVAYTIPILSATADELLPAVTAGRRRVSFGSGGKNVHSSGQSLSGDWDLVPSFSPADHYLLAEGTSSPARIWVADAAQPEIGTEKLTSIDLAGTMQSLRLARAPARLVASLTAERLRELDTRARLLLAAELAGVADAAIAAAADYANVRTTFGHVIGSYQAISHPLADSLAQVEGLRSLIYWTACQMEAGDSEATRLSLAVKARAGDVAVQATERALHTFGGIGFTWEHPIHRYYRRAIAANATAGPSFQLSHQLGLDLLASFASSPEHSSQEDDLY